MRERKTPKRFKTENPGYYKIELGDDRILYFRVPLPLHGSRILKALDTHDLKSFKDIDDKDISDADMDKASTLWAICGAAMGYSWAHPDLELEVRPGGDLLTYGEEVLTELYEDHDLELDDFHEVFPEVVKRITLSVVSKRAKRRADFSGPSEDTPN